MVAVLVTGVRAHLERPKVSWVQFPMLVSMLVHGPDVYARRFWSFVDDGWEPINVAFSQHK